MKFKNVLFDVDGTIVASEEGVIKSIEYALNKLGIYNYQREVLIKFLGPPLSDSFMKYFNMTEDNAEKAVSFYRERYTDIGIYESTVYDGIPELLKSLKSNGVRLYTASSKPEKYVEKILKKTGLYDYFDFVAGASLDKSRKTKEEVLQYLIDKVNPDISETVLVGDRFYDIVGAHHFGLKCIAVLYGYGDLKEFLQYNADYIARTTADIEKLII